MKNKLLVSLIFCTFCYAQNNANISGQIVEKETSNVLPFVQVVLSPAEYNSIIAGTLSDNEGRFTFSGMSQGSYILRFSFIGFTEIAIPIFIGKTNTNYDIGTIKLESKVLQTEDIVVEATRAILSSGLEKKSFKMDEYFTQSGGSVLEALKSLPGVTVDQDGKVLLRSSDKVMILIDEKQSSLTGFGNQKGLDNIPATNIESIEIINNPSAKYETTGMAGIINIVNKKENKTGLYGELGFAFGLSDLTTRKQDLPTELGRYSKNPKYIPSLGLNYANQNVRFFLHSEVLRQRRLPNNEFTTRTYKDGRRTVSQVPENRTHIKSDC